MADVVVIRTTLDSAELAEQLARQAVEQRLAACVQITPAIRSTYRWQGEIETATEWLLEIKTTPAMRQKTIDWLSSAHPYELPEIIWRCDHATRAYSDWVQRETGVIDD